MHSIASARPDAHEKTLDLRIARLRTAVEHATAIHRSGEDSAGQASRTLVILMENKALVAAHAQGLISTITREVAAADQDDMLLVRVRPLTLLVEEANIAIARLQVILGDTA